MGRIIVRATLGAEMRPRFAKIGGHSLLQTVNLQVLEIAGSSFQERDESKRSISKNKNRHLSKRALKLYESLNKIKAAFQSRQLLNVAPVLLAIK